MSADRMAPRAGGPGAGSQPRSALLAGSALALAGYALFSVSLGAERVQWAPLEAQAGPAGALAELAARVSRARAASGIAAAEDPLWSAAFGLGLASASVGWLLLVRAARAQALSRAGVIALALACAGLAGSAPGLLSSDVSLYIRVGRMAALFGANPFLHPPAAVPDAYVDDRWFMAEFPSLYGPLWIGFAAALAKLADVAGLDFPASVALYRVLAIGCHGLNAALVQRIAQALRPGSAVAASAAYGLCPLAIVEFGSSAHNDVFVIALLLFGIQAELRSRSAWASLLFAFASLIKLYALLAWAAHALLVARSSRSPGEAVARTLPMALGGLALAALAYLPFWEGAAGSLRMLLGLLLGRAPTNSLAEWIALQVPPLVGALEPGLRLRLASLLCAGALAVTIAVLAARIRDLTSFLRALHGGFFAWSTFGASWNQPWYALPATALAAIAPASPLRSATWVLSLAVLALYALHALERPGLYAHRAVVMAGLPLLYLALAWLAAPRPTRSPPRPPRVRPRRPGA